MACRKHLENLKPKIADGTVVFGGGSLDEPVKEGEGPKINGSVMVIMADSEEEALKFVHSDIYTESDVWNVSKVSRLALAVFSHPLKHDCRPRYSHSGALYERNCSKSTLVFPAAIETLSVKATKLRAGGALSDFPRSPISQVINTRGNPSFMCKQNSHANAPRAFLLRCGHRFVKP